MTLGMACGVPAMILKFILVDPLCGEPEYRPTLFTIHYLYVGMMLAGITLVVSVMITYVTPPPDSESVSFCATTVTVCTLNHNLFSKVLKVNAYDLAIVVMVTSSI